MASRVRVQTAVMTVFFAASVFNSIQFNCFLMQRVKIPQLQTFRENATNTQWIRNESDQER